MLPNSRYLHNPKQFNDGKNLGKIVYTVMLSDQPQLRCLLFHMKNFDTEENIELQNKLYS